MVQRIQIRHAKEWQQPPNTVRTDTPSLWANPFHTHGDDIALHSLHSDLAFSMFEDMIVKCHGWVAHRGHVKVVISVADVRERLKGKNLACTCALDQQCHADLLLKIANSA
jgi:Domain of unknown function (DUF4326)